MSRLRWPRYAAVLALLGGLFTSSLGDADATSHSVEWTYFTMSDDTKIAAAISYPNGFDRQDDAPIPVLLQYDGYGAGGSNGINPASYGDRYITVYASIRGTGCSGGAFNLFDRRQAEDGYEMVTDHLPTLPGSNGDVGIIGHSYPGLTGWLTASTNPPNLKAIAISGLIDDLYRGIVYPGGVPNYGFPALWTGALRPALEHSGNLPRYTSPAEIPGCAANVATRPTDAHGTLNSVVENPIVNGATSLEDSSWFKLRSTVTWVDGITKPIHITQQFQDEQTGPRGGHVLFERINENVPKRLVMTNGVHGTTSVAHNDRVAWLDCWILEDASQCAKVENPDERVNLLVDTTSGVAVQAGEFDYTTSDWPAPETDWTRYYLRADGTLSTTAGGATEGTRSYVHTPEGRPVTGDSGGLAPSQVEQNLGALTFGDGPDMLRYDLAIPTAANGGTPLSVAGPINLTLSASSTAPNTDFFVDVLDVAPNGDVHYLQRGMQRASHRAINDHPTRTDYVDDDPTKPMYRAWHPHTNTATKLLTPTVAETFEIEVFPIGHVFRPGHTLRIQVHAPPPADPLSVYAWVSGLPPAVNTVLHAGASSILLPLLPTTPIIPAVEPACGARIGVPCFHPAADLPGLP